MCHLYGNCVAIFGVSFWKIYFSIKNEMQFCCVLLVYLKRNDVIMIDESTSTTVLMQSQRNYFGIIKTTNNSLHCQKIFQIESTRYFQYLMDELKVICCCVLNHCIMVLMSFIFMFYYFRKIHLIFLDLCLNG